MALTSPVEESPPHPRGSRLARYLALAYTLLIVYASLSPFTGWRDPGGQFLSFLTTPWPRYYTRFDIIINFLAYLPLGFLAALAFLSRLKALSSTVAATLACCFLSVVMEAVQGYLPGRISSNLDLLMNGLGSLSGAIMAARAGHLPLITQLASLRDKWFLPGSIGDWGLALLALWFFAQLNPSLPLLGIVFFSQDMNLPFTGHPAPRPFSLPGTLSVTLNLTAVGLLLIATMRSAKTAVAALLALVLVASLIKLLASVVLLRPEALFQWIGPEVAIGIGYGLFLIVMILTLNRHRIIFLCAIALVLAAIAAHIQPGQANPALALRLFNWHYGQLLNYTGLVRAVAELWPFLALLYLFVFSRRSSPV